MHDSIRDIDLNYNVASLIRDLSHIREQTFKESTITHSFQKAGIWPISLNIAIQKLRVYSKPKPQRRRRPITPPLTLPLRPITPKPSSYKESERGLQRWTIKLTGLLSSPSQKSYDNFSTGIAEVLASGRLEQLDLQVLRQQVDGKKGKNRSRAQLQVGGELTIERAHELRAAKAEEAARKARAKEARIAREAASRAKKQLRRLGVDARKQERLRKKRVKALLRAGNPVPPEDLDPIPDPEAGSKPEPEAGSVLGFNSEPGFELELDPGSQLALQLQRELENTGEWGEEWEWPSQATQKAKPRQATPNYAKSRIVPPQLRRHKTTTTQDNDDTRRDRYKTTDKTRIYTMPWMAKVAGEEGKKGRGLFPEP
ncbi:hypothetical protein V498_07945, partial [Pseudogymnoascus sp. VKM F-4517 (FW-2822)]